MKKIISHSDTGTRYLEIKNKEGKIWLIPFASVRKGLELYQPSSKKGVLLKKYISAFKYLPFILSKFGINIVQLTIDSDFSSIVQDLFDTTGIMYSLFLGTPGRDNKPTIQLYTSKRILAYCKFSSNPRICVSFYKEARAFEYLHSKGLTTIPKLLYLDQVDEDQTIFVQSTNKNFNAVTLHEITDKHVEFLLDLSNKTRKICYFNDTDYYKMLQDFETNLKKMPFLCDEDMIEEIIQLIKNKLENVKEYSFYHGDFTPWNTYLSKSNSIEAFDLEYAKYTYPKMLDIFHFFTQIKLYESDENVDEILIDFKRYFIFGDLSGLFENAYLSYLFYLVDIINFYLERDYGAFSEKTIRCLETRYELMVYCYDKCLEREKDESSE